MHCLEKNQALGLTNDECSRQVADLQPEGREGFLLSSPFSGGGMRGGAVQNGHFWGAEGNGS